LAADLSQSHYLHPVTCITITDVFCLSVCASVYLSVRVHACISTVQEEPVLASVRKPTMPAISELLDSTFNILDEENNHRLPTVDIYISGCN